MAKYQITYACGCTKEVQLYGKHEDRERRIKYLETQTCFDSQREAENAHAEKAKEARGLAELTGSVKQVAWANSIREAAYKCLDALYGLVTDERGTQMLDGWRAKMDAQTTAKWWIDERYSLPQSEQQSRENVGKFNAMFK